MDQHARPTPRGHPIIVGIGEQHGAVALTWAIGMARTLNARVIAVPAFDPRGERRGIPSLAPPSAAVPRTHDEERELLLEVAEREGASMIVVCSGGNAAPAALVHESVSHELIHRGRFPIVVVPPGWGPPAASPAGPGGSHA